MDLDWGPTLISFFFCSFEEVVGLATMLNSEATKMARILWSLGWLHPDELKGVIGECTNLVC